MTNDVTMYHRPVVLTTDGERPLADWSTWAEARAVLVMHGLAFYIYGIFTMLPVARIEKETYYG